MCVFEIYYSYLVLKPVLSFFNVQFFVSQFLFSLLFLQTFYTCLFHVFIRSSEVFGMSKSYIYCFWCCPIISNSFQPHGLGPPGSPGSSVHGILQARTLEWVAISFSGGASPPRYQNPISCVSCIGRQILPTSATWEALYCFCCLSIISCICVCVCVFKLWIIFY